MSGRSVKFFGVHIAAMLLMAAPVLAQSTASPITECDEIAASPLDPDKPEDVAGVSFDDLEGSDEAIEVCEAAIEDHPLERRFLTHLARLYSHADREAEALKSNLRASELGSALAAHNIAVMYANGIGVEVDQDKATQYYKRAAHRGLALSMYDLGQRMRDAENWPQARFWYEKAAEAGFSRGSNNAGVIFRDGLGTRQNSGKAFAYFARAVDLDADNAIAQYNLAEAYLHGAGTTADAVKALTHYERSAELGDMEGANQTGHMYQRAIGTAENSERALHWFKVAADAEHATGFYNMGWVSEHGYGVEANGEQSLLYYQRAAELGDGDAASNAGYIYEAGELVPADPGKAFDLYQKAHDLGSAYGTANLGDAYRTGLGVDADPAKARDLMRRSLEGDLDTEFRKWVEKTLAELGGN